MRKNCSLRLLLVDDHEVVRLGLESVFKLTPGLEVVAHAGTKDSAVAAAIRTQPDVVLLDIRLPDQSGIDAAREILARCPETKVLFLTSFIDDHTVLDAVLSGAHGYILKDIGATGLIQAIRTVAAGRPLLDPRVTERTLSWLKNLSTAGHKARSHALSPQEQRILPLIAEGKTNKEIALELGLTEKTVKNYLANMYAKLHITRRSQAAALYAKRFVPDPEHVASRLAKVLR